MNITYKRNRTEVATGPHGNREQRDRDTWELKQLLFNLGIIKNLG